MRVYVYLFCVLLLPVVSFAQPKWVNDGLGEDIDWTNQTRQLSANWAVVPRVNGYWYAIGTTPGGTDITGGWKWNPGNQNTSATVTGLNLLHGRTYYFSVKTERRVNTSDGITVDTVLLTSKVNPLPPTQTSLSFIVTWSGRDDLSGISHYDIQYKDGEGPWQDWLTSTTLTSSTFTGEDGHTYYFRCRATDNAGNQEAYPSIPDAYTTINIAGISLQVTPSPSSLIFYQDEEVKSIVYTLQVIGPVGVNINLERIRYEYESGAVEEEVSIASVSIPPGGSLELSREVVVDNTRRAQVLFGRDTGTFTVTREFSGYDANNNPVSASSSVLVQVTTLPSERFKVEGMEIFLPDEVQVDEELRGRIRFDTSGPPGDVSGALYIDRRGWRSFNVSGVRDGDVIQTPPLPTSVIGTHILGVLITLPNRIGTEAEYEVTREIVGVDFIGTPSR